MGLSLGQIATINPDFSFQYPRTASNQVQDVRGRLIHEASRGIYLTFAQCKPSDSACISSYLEKGDNAPPYHTLYKINHRTGAVVWGPLALPVVKTSLFMTTRDGQYQEQGGDVTIAASSNGATILVSAVGSYIAYDTTLGTQLWKKDVPAGGLAPGGSALVSLELAAQNSQGVARSSGGSSPANTPYFYYSAYLGQLGQTAQEPKTTILPQALAGGFLVAIQDVNPDTKTTAISVSHVAERTGEPLWPSVLSPFVVPFSAGPAYFAVDPQRTTLVLVGPGGVTNNVTPPVGWSGNPAFISLSTGTAAYPLIPMGAELFFYSTASILPPLGNPPLLLALADADSKPAPLSQGGPFNSTRARSLLYGFTLPEGSMVVQLPFEDPQAAPDGTVRAAVAAGTAFGARFGLSSLAMGNGVVDPAKFKAGDLVFGRNYDPTSFVSSFSGPSLTLQSPKAIFGSTEGSLALQWRWILPSGGAVTPSPQLNTPDSWTITTFGPVTTGPPCDPSAAAAKVSMRAAITTAPGDPRPALLVPTYRTILRAPLTTSCAGTKFMDTSRIVDVTTTLYLLDARTGVPIWASPGRPASADADPTAAQNLLIAPSCALGTGSFVLRATNSSGSVITDPSKFSTPDPRFLWGMSRLGGFSWTARVEYQTVYCGNSSFYAVGLNGLTRYTPPFSNARPYIYPAQAQTFVIAPYIFVIFLFFYSACRGKE